MKQTLWEELYCWMSSPCQVHGVWQGLWWRSSTGELLGRAVIIWCLLTTFKFCSKHGDCCKTRAAVGCQTCVPLGGLGQEQSFWLCWLGLGGRIDGQDTPEGGHHLLVWHSGLISLWFCLVFGLSSWNLANCLSEDFSQSSGTMFECEPRKTNCIAHSKNLLEFLLRKPSTSVAHRGKNGNLGGHPLYCECSFITLRNLWACCNPLRNHTLLMESPLSAKAFVMVQLLWMSGLSMHPPGVQTLLSEQPDAHRKQRQRMIFPTAPA